MNKHIDMGVNKDMDLFETVRDKLGCEYISDMRSCRALLNDAKKGCSQLRLGGIYRAGTCRYGGISVRKENVWCREGGYYLLFKADTIRKAYGKVIPIGFSCY